MAMSRNPSPRLSPIAPPSPRGLVPLTLTASNDSTVIRQPILDTIPEHTHSEHTHRPVVHPRTASVGSIRFEEVKALRPAAARGIRRRASNGSARNISPPPPAKFKGHVSFENFDNVRATEKNAISITLNSKHTGYHWTRRSRTFMVGVDDKSYSDVALRWMLEELVDDGDTIICLRVKEKEAVEDEYKAHEYKQSARDILAQIQERNEAHRAISIVLEFAIGDRIHTFQRMIALHEPAMLIVGTKGKSLQGVQGLLGGRTSFSKWALQYSPIPVVVVRSAAQRGKKKIKRDRDPQRGEYIKMLRDSGVNVHESEAVAKSNIFEAPNTPDVEAHAVISALGLPENFKNIPRLQPLTTADGDLFPFDVTLRHAADHPSEVTLVGDSQQNSPNIAAVESPDTDSGSDSESEDSGDEFEAIDARTLLQNSASEDERKQKLQKMKEDEARAFAIRAPKQVNADGGTDSLRKTSVESVESGSGEKRSSEDDEDEEGSQERIRGVRKSSLASTASTSSDYSATSEKRKLSAKSDLYDDDEISSLLEKIDSNFSIASGPGCAGSLHRENSGDSAVSPRSEGVESSEAIDENAVSPRTLADDPLRNVDVVTDPTVVVGSVDGKD